MKKESKIVIKSLKEMGKNLDLISLGKAKKDILSFNDPIAEGHILLEYARYYYQHDRDSSKYFFNLAEQHASGIKDYDLLFTMMMVQVANNKLDKPLALSYLQKADSIADLSKDQKKIPIPNERLGGIYFNTNPQKSIQHFQKAADAYVAINDKKKAGFCNQNIAFIYDEKLNEYPKALSHSNIALNIWQDLSDTLNEANILKYIGLLEGKLKSFDAAKNHIATAIEKFQQKKNDRGIAVCYFDLGQVYFEEGKLDSSIVQYNKALNIWEKTTDYNRMVGINTQKIKALDAMDNSLEAKSIIKANEAMINQHQIGWQDRISFYEMAKDFYSKNENEPKATLYQSQFKKLSDSLDIAGIKR